MTKQERFEKEIKDFQEWMSDSAGINIDDTIDDLAKDCGETYEVKVNVHLVSGLIISLCNNCAQSYFNNQYCGDKIFMYDGLVNIYFTDKEGRYHQTIIRPEYITMIDAWTEHVDWQAYIDKQQERDNKK